jgi:hypothetical protein
MRLATATQLLEILVPIAETMPAPVGTPLKGALDALSKIMKYAQVCLCILQFNIRCLSDGAGGEGEQEAGIGTCRARE